MQEEGGRGEGEGEGRGGKEGRRQEKGGRRERQVRGEVLDTNDICITRANTVTEPPHKDQYVSIW